mgnify:CR=1 FL=1|jgi:conjugative coupling factor TraD (TOL family)
MIGAPFLIDAINHSGIARFLAFSFPYFSNQFVQPLCSLIDAKSVTVSILSRMSNQHPIESLMRPPVELSSSLAYACGAGLAVMSPGMLLTVPSVAYSLAAFCGYRFFTRTASAVQLMKYQHGLTVLPWWEISSTEIPCSKKDLFLGKGFEWEAIHTQRHHDCKQPENRHIVKRYSTPGYKRARQIESAFKRSPLTTSLGNLLGSTHWVNPWSPVNLDLGGDTTTHGVGLWEGEYDITEPQSERVAHKFVVGTTRVGKTRLCEVLVTQDIHNDDVVIVFDPKGDAELLIRMWAESVKAGREHQFYMFHLGYPDVSCRYNPVGSFGRITEPASRIASQLPGEGNSAAFREFAWRYVNVISRAGTELGKRLSYEFYLQYGADIDPLLYEYLQAVFKKNEAEFPKWKKDIEKVEESDRKPDRSMSARDRKAWAAVVVYKEYGLYDEVAHALIKTFEYEKSFYDKLVASLFPLLEKLCAGKTGQLLSPDYLDLEDKRPIIDWKSIIRQGGIVYIGLDALSDAEVASAVGSSMFADLTSTAGSIYKFGSDQGLLKVDGRNGKKRKVCLHLDEFNELVGKEFVPMANKAGGAGFQLTAYTQTMSDIIVRFGDTAKAAQVIGNLGSIIMLRVKELATAELLTEQLPDVDVHTLGLRSGATDSPASEEVDFVSSTQQHIGTQRVPLLHPGDVTRLPKGQAFALVGSRLYKIRLPMLNDEKSLPSDLSFVTNEMRKQYAAKNSESWHKMPARWAEVA